MSGLDDLLKWQKSLQGQPGPTNTEILALANPTPTFPAASEPGVVIPPQGPSAPSDNSNAVPFIKGSAQQQAAFQAMVSGDGNSRFASAIRAHKKGLRPRPAIIYGQGDSNFVGRGAGTDLNVANAFGLGPIEQIAGQLPTINGLPVRTTSWFGEGGLAAANPALYNPRLTLGSGWTCTTQFGGGYFMKSSTVGGYLSYNFGSAVDTVEIYCIYGAAHTNSVQVYNSSDVLQGTLSFLAGSGYTAAKFQVSGSFPDGIVKIKNNQAADCYIAGQIAWLSTEKSVVIARMAFGGSKAADWTVAVNSYDGMGYVPLIAPDVSICSLTINDIDAATAAATYNSSLDTIAAGLSKWGDVVLSTGGNGSGAHFSDGGREVIEAEVVKVAAKYGARTVSMHKEWYSWAATNAIGWEADANHRKAAGYADQARVYAAALLRIAGT